MKLQHWTFRCDADVIQHNRSTGNRLFWNISSIIYRDRVLCSGEERSVTSKFYFIFQSKLKTPHPPKHVHSCQAPSCYADISLVFPGKFGALTRRRIMSSSIGFLVFIKYFLHLLVRLSRCVCPLFKVVHLPFVLFFSRTIFIRLFLSPFSSCYFFLLSICPSGSSQTFSLAAFRALLL